MVSLIDESFLQNIEFTAFSFESLRVDGNIAE